MQVINRMADRLLSAAVPRITAGECWLFSSAPAPREGLCREGELA